MEGVESGDEPVFSIGGEGFGVDESIEATGRAGGHVKSLGKRGRENSRKLENVLRSDLTGSSHAERMHVIATFQAR